MLYEISLGKDRQDFPQLPPDLQSHPDHAALLELNEVILKACETDFRKRYQTAQQMHDDLALLERGESVKGKRVAERRLTIARKIVLAAGAVLLVAGGFWFMSPLSEKTAVKVQTTKPLQPMPHPEAEKLYRQAQACPLNTKQGLSQAIELANHAVVADPAYAPAYALLGQAYMQLAVWGLRHKQAMAEARKNAARALELDDANERAHVAMGLFLFRYEWDWAGGEAEFRRAIECNPTNAQTFGWLGQELAARGHFERAEDALKRATELGPRMMHTLACLGYSHCYRRRYREAIEVAKESQELYPQDVSSRKIAALAYERLGHYAEALVAAEKGRQLDAAPDTVAWLGFVQARAGQRAAAERTLAELTQMADAGGYMPSFYKALMNVGLGRKDEAMKYLEQAFAERSPDMARLETLAWLDDLRSDPRFVKLLSQVRGQK